jgi:hypothetical protein
MDSLYESWKIDTLDVWVNQHSHHTSKHETEKDECTFGFDEKNDLKYIYFVYDRFYWSDGCPDPDNNSWASSFHYIFISFLQSQVQYINYGSYSTEEDTISVDEAFNESINLFEDGILSSRKSRSSFSVSCTQEHEERMKDVWTVLSSDIPDLLSLIPLCKFKVNDNQVIALSHP